MMARLDAKVFHGRDAQQAIRGVRLKAWHAGAFHVRPVGGYELSIEAFIERYSRFDGIDISVEDAWDTGACEYGIQSWCQAVGIDTSDERAPMHRVLDGSRMQPQIEVRRAVLLAVKRHRAETRQLADSPLCESY